MRALTLLPAALLALASLPAAAAEGIWRPERVQAVAGSGCKCFESTQDRSTANWSADFVKAMQSGGFPVGRLAPDYLVVNNTTYGVVSVSDASGLRDDKTYAAVYVADVNTDGALDIVFLDIVPSEPKTFIADMSVVFSVNTRSQGAVEVGQRWTGRLSRVDPDTLKVESADSAFTPPLNFIVGHAITFGSAVGDQKKEAEGKEGKGGKKGGDGKGGKKDDGKEGKGGKKGGK
jgi:hypothetical protein